MPRDRRRKGAWRFNERVEHRLQVERRAADDLQHVRRRGLVFEQFRQIVGALVQFVEQPDVLDGDDRLVGEGLQQIDLLVLEQLTSPCGRS